MWRWRTRKDLIILINYLHLKFKSSRLLKQLWKYLFIPILKIFCSEKLLQTFIKKFVVDFIFSKIPYFQHIFLDSFRQMRLKCEKYSLRRILF